jgi:hypothetical protein
VSSLPSLGGSMKQPAFGGFDEINIDEDEEAKAKRE